MIKIRSIQRTFKIPKGIIGVDYIIIYIYTVCYRLHTNQDYKAATSLTQYRYSISHTVHDDENRSKYRLYTNLIQLSAFFIIIDVIM